jgi:hypothetical protein
MKLLHKEVLLVNYASTCMFARDGNWIGNGQKTDGRGRPRSTPCFPGCVFIDQFCSLYCMEDYANYTTFAGIVQYCLYGSVCHCMEGWIRKRSWTFSALWLIRAFSLVAMAQTPLSWSMDRLIVRSPLDINLRGIGNYSIARTYANYLFIISDLTLTKIRKNTIQGRRSKESKRKSDGKLTYLWRDGS